MNDTPRGFMRLTDPAESDKFYVRPEQIITIYPASYRRTEIVLATGKHILCSEDIEMVIKLINKATENNGEHKTA